MCSTMELAMIAIDMSKLCVFLVIMVLNTTVEE